jgi:hypothetical protein
MPTLLTLILVIWPALVWAHAFPDHSEPRVGHTVDPPSSVRVWFDGALEPRAQRVSCRTEPIHSRETSYASLKHPLARC